MAMDAGTSCPRVKSFSNKFKCSHIHAQFAKHYISIYIAIPGKVLFDFCEMDK